MTCLLDEGQHQGKRRQAKDGCQDGKQLAGPACLVGIWQVLPAHSNSSRSSHPPQIELESSRAFKASTRDGWSWQQQQAQKS